MDTRAGFTLVFTAVAAARLVELGISRRNVQRLLARGGVKTGESHYPWMVALHTAFLIGCPLEVWLLDRPWIPALASPMAMLVVAAMVLRYWVMATLGERWCTRVVCLPGEPLLGGGPYRFMRHPNYAAVVVEMVALPLLHTAWLSALFFSFANLLVLQRRIRVEEEALTRLASVTQGRRG
jgi:methyltransferase